MVPAPVLELGDAEGPGIIESSSVRVIHDPASDRFGVYSIGGTRLKIFDGKGQFVRSVGRRGEGPGELTALIDAQFTSQGHVAFLDNRGVWVVLDPAGALVLHTRADVLPGRFRLLGSDTAVVGRMVRTAELVGYPLHLTALRNEGEPLHFGADDPTYNRADFYGEVVQVWVTPPFRSVWWANAGAFRFEEWSIDGALLRRVKSELPWFPGTTYASRDREGKPNPIMVSFAVDSGDRLWVVTRQADPEWREVETTGREGFVRRGSRDDFWDVRVDVFDLDSRRQLGYRVMDTSSANLVWYYDEVLLSVVEIHEGMVPRVVLHRFDLGW